MQTKINYKSFQIVAHTHSKLVSIQEYFSDLSCANIFFFIINAFCTEFQTLKSIAAGIFKNRFSTFILVSANHDS